MQGFFTESNFCDKVLNYKCRVTSPAFMESIQKGWTDELDLYSSFYKNFLDFVNHLGEKMTKKIQEFFKKFQTDKSLENPKNQSLKNTIDLERNITFIINILFELKQILLIKSLQLEHQSPSKSFIWEVSHV